MRARVEKVDVLGWNKFVAKWLVKSKIWSEMCRTELKMVCPTIFLSGTDSIITFTILVMVVTVAVIAAMVAPFLS